MESLIILIPISVTFALLTLIFVLFKMISDVNEKLNRLNAIVNNRFKEVDDTFLSVARSLQLVSETLSNNRTSPLESLLNDRIKKVGNATERFTKITEITKQQLDMMPSLDTPNKSASHSKHKNTVAKQLKSLEEEKRTIMQSLIDDGVDPEITAFDENGEAKKMKMSEAMRSTPLDQDPQSTDKKSHKKNGNVISLFEKGDDDDEDNSGNPTLH